MKIHNGDIQGITGKTFLSPYRIKHYGYVYKAKIEEKMKTYTEADANKSRDYEKTIDPRVEFKSFKFYEFENHFVNLLYIYFYKYFLNVLWILERVRLKLKKYV